MYHTPPLFIADILKWSQQHQISCSSAFVVHTDNSKIYVVGFRCKQFLFGNKSLFSTFFYFRLFTNIYLRKWVPNTVQRERYCQSSSLLLHFYFSHASFKPFFQAFQTSLHLYAQYELQVQHHILSSDTSESTDRGIRTMKIKNTQKEWLSYWVHHP